MIDKAFYNTKNVFELQKLRKACVERIETIDEIIKEKSGIGK